MSKLPNVGMVAIPDYVDNIRDIHPKYKRPVGERLAHWALGEKYNKKTAAYRHPSFLKMERRTPEYGYGLIMPMLESFVKEKNRLLWRLQEKI